MKVNTLSLCIGIAIGATAVTIPSILLLSLANSDNREEAAAFFVGGYLVDMSAEDNTMTLTQSTRDFWMANDYVRNGDMTIIGGLIYGCGFPESDSLTLEKCAEKFKVGEIPSWTVVCAHVRLEDGELHGGKVFLAPRTQGCNIESQESVSASS